MAVSQVPPEVRALRHRIRHSAAHVMADAVLELFPEATFAIGPPTDDGFYYDFGVSQPFTPEDLGRIDGLMRERIAADTGFVRSELGRQEAAELFQHQPFKQEIIEEIPEEEAISLYRHGDFTDLCEGPHVERTGQIAAFKLLTIAGAYWRGDEHRPMLQRIYGTAFESQEALAEHLRLREEAERRDHRRLGRELGLFLFDPVAPGSPFFLPKGALVYTMLVDYVRGLYERYGYQEVITPQIFSTELWKRSGHYDNYIENMYLVEAEEQEYGVKPMNCPGHALLYAAELHSYRDLPLRYADFGRLHRNERSGVTHGLTRVRSFSQDDAHIFCTQEQIAAEVAGFVEMASESYRVFGFDDVRVVLSLRPEKRVGSDEVWDRAEAALAGGASGAGSAPRDGARRRGLLRPEDRLLRARRDRPRVAAGHGAAGLLDAGALRPGVRRRGRLAAAAGDGPPGHAGVAGALPGGAHRALRRGVPAVARARAGGR